MIEGKIIACNPYYSVGWAMPTLPFHFTSTRYVLTRTEVMELMGTAQMWEIQS